MKEEKINRARHIRIEFESIEGYQQHLAKGEIVIQGQIMALDEFLVS
jgi:hypothetical protein